jgi:hypothetical protein
LKRGKEGVVLIDKYGMGWCLKGNRKNESSLNREYDKKLGFDYTKIEINRCNCMKGYNYINNINKLK